jgi:hypothetical protein
MTTSKIQQGMISQGVRVYGEVLPRRDGLVQGVSGRHDEVRTSSCTAVHQNRINVTRPCPGVGKRCPDP